MKTKDITARLEKLSLQKKAWIDNKEFNRLSNELMPGMGAADTVEGEIIRAVNRIAYRYFNDGDRAFSGYGNETVNPAWRYLDSKSSLIPGISEVLNRLKRTNLDSEYEANLVKLVDLVTNYIKSIPEESRTPNTEDMLDYSEPGDRNYDDEDYDDEDYDDEDYDDEY